MTKKLINLGHLVLLLPLSFPLLWLPGSGPTNSSISFVKNLLYYYQQNCKLFQMFWPIVDRKVDKFKTFGIAAGIVFAVVA